MRAGYRVWREIEKSRKEGMVDFSVCGPHINRVFTDLGPTFIKLGQMLSLRPDIIPSELADELRKLLDHGVAVDAVAAKRLFQEDLGKTTDAAFDSFADTPFAVASLAQVHKARLGSKVLAVKIQKPGIRAIIDRDMALAKTLVWFCQLDARLRRAKPIIESAVDEFFKWITHELDYRLEALNISRMRKNFAHVKFFRAPEVMHELSGKRVLTMAYIEGVSMNELFDAVPDLSLKDTITYKSIMFRKALFIKHSIGIVYKQIYEDGFFHADPHPANILLTPDNCIAYIDFGVVGVLRPNLQQSLFAMSRGIIERDVKKLARALVGMDEVEGHADLAHIEEKIKAVLDDWQSGSIIEMSTAEMFYRLILVALDSGIDIPIALVALGKAILTYDGGLRKFDPELDLIKACQAHFVEKGGSAVTGGFAGALPVLVKDILKEIEHFPSDVHALVESLAKDGVEFTVRFGPADRTHRIKVEQT